MTCFFKDNAESRMNPMFLTESEKGMLWQPRVIESGREMIAGFDEEKNRKEELLFCCRWVWVDFLSSMLWCYLCMHRVLCRGCLFHWEGRISGAACHLRKVDGLQNGLQWCQRVVWCTGRRERAPAPSVLPTYIAYCQQKRYTVLSTFIAYCR